MQIKIKKKNELAKMPTKAHPSDAGFDLVATSKDVDEYGNIVYGTGLAFEIPLGYVGLVFPRSSNAKKDLFLTNSVGVIDSGYRGEVLFKFRPTWLDSGNHYEVGDRVGQIIIMPYPEIEFMEVEELSASDRGESGYGGSGR